MSEWLSDWYEGVHSSVYDFVWWSAVGLVVIFTYFGIRIFLSERTNEGEYEDGVHENEELSRIHFARCSSIRGSLSSK